MPGNSTRTDGARPPALHIRLRVVPLSGIDRALHEALAAIPPRARARWVRDMAYLGLLSSRGTVAEGPVFQSPMPVSIPPAGKPARSPQLTELLKHMQAQYPDHE